MKSKCSFILKASTALVLALLMLFGSVTTVIGATAGTAAGDSALTLTAKKVVDIAETGAKVDLASTGNNTIYLLLSGTHSTVKINIHKGTGSGDPWFTDAMTDTGNTYYGSIIYSASINDEWGGLGKFEFNVDGTYRDVFGNGDTWHNDPSIWRGRMYDWDNSTWMDYATNQPLITPTISIGGKTSGVTVASGSTAAVKITNWSDFSGSISGGYCTLALYKGDTKIGNNITAETTNFTFTESGDYYVKCEPTASTEATYYASSSSTVDVTVTLTIYVKNAADWTNIYYYLYTSDSSHGDAWPGTKITSSPIGTIDTKDVYKVENVPQYSYIILNNNSNKQYPNEVALANGKLYPTGTTAPTVVDYSSSLLDKPKYDVTFTPSLTGGTVKVDGSSTSPAKVSEDEDFTILAKPNAGYTIDTVKVGTTTLTAQSGGSDSAGYTYTYNVGKAAKTVTATFKKVNYTVTLNKNADSATAGTASVTAKYGEAMPTATMPTRTGYNFAGYYDTSATSGGKQYYTAAGASARTWDKTANTTLYARWTAIDYNITKTVSPSAAGTLSVKKSSTEVSIYHIGETLSVTAPSNSAYTFNNITVKYGDGTADLVHTTSTTLSLNMTGHTGDITITANYTAKPTKPITIVNATPRLGTVTVSPENAYEGQQVTVTVEENGGTLNTLKWKNISTSEETTLYTKTSVSGILGRVKELIATGAKADLASTGATTTRTFIMPAADVTVTATFDEYSAPSNWYYNGYDDKGAQKTGYYGKQMTEGKLGGVEYSYFNVNGRTEDDQIFTVAEKAGGTRFVYLTTKKDYNDWKLSSSESPTAYFFNSSGAVGTEFPGTAMTWISGEGDNVDKNWKIEIPSEASGVIFVNGRTGDSRKQTVDLAIAESNACYYINGYDNGQSKYTCANWTEPGENAGLGATEYFYSTDGGATAGSYTTGLGYNGDFWDHGITVSNVYKKYAKPKNLNDYKSNYYILVLYPNKTYNYNGLTLTTDASKPTILWADKLPGDVTSSAKVYAKDGAAPINWNNKTTGGASDLNGSAYNYAAIASTKIIKIDDNTSPDVTTVNVGDASSQYQTASIQPGQKLYITTTIDSTYASRFYVRGFCVNGTTYYGGDGTKNVSSVNEDGKTNDNKYSLVYVVPTPGEGETLNDIEITPIYYYVRSQVPTGVDIITFYLQNFSSVVDRGWGNTPYVYPFYGNAEGIANSFGSYPGQPMVNLNGTYSIQVPVKNLTIKESVKSSYYPNLTNVYNQLEIKGITVNNGYADHVHRNIINHWTTGTDVGDDKDHKQTYDYDDFFKIYHEKNTSTKKINSITLRLKYESDTYNASEYGKLSKGNQLVSGSHATLTAADIAAINNGNGWEDLTNFFNEKTNIFGSTEGLNTSADPLYVISTGYNANIAGDYGTAWMIYEKKAGASNYTLVKSTKNSRYATPPSVFILNDDDSFEDSAAYPEANRKDLPGVGDYKDDITNYQEIYDYLKTNYSDRLVKITYEMDHQDTRNIAAGTGAFRMDGRWFYTFDSDYVNANIKIQYFDKSTKTYVDDADTSATDGDYIGSKTGTKAYFTANTDYTGTHSVNSGNKVMQTGSYSFKTEAASGWEFKGWYIQYDETSTPTSMDLADLMATVKAEASATIIARYAPTTSGDLTITHNVKSDSVGEGVAVVEKVVIKDGNGNVVETVLNNNNTGIAYIDGTYISSANANSGYKIEVTLKATASVDDTFNEFVYDAAVTTTTPSLTGDTRTKRSTFTINMSDLFNSSDNTQKVTELDYYSSFNKTEHYYEFIYHYNDRAGNAKSYTVRGTFDDYLKYVNIPEQDQGQRTVKDSFINTKSPFESNFNENLALDLEADGNTNTYDASSHTHTVNAYYTGDKAVYRAEFVLPYDYYTEAGSADTSGNAYKAYTAIKDSSGNVQKATDKTVIIKNIGYEDYFTANGEQTKVEKDSASPNHVGNDFITAPETIVDNGTTKYFSYWAVYEYDNHESLVTRVYYPDFHHRAYGNYYVVPVYDANEQNSYNLIGVENNDFDASVLYLGSSRNQWNMTGSSKSESTGTSASDLIYNDFAFAYSYHGKEIVNLSSTEKDNLQIGMYIERVKAKDSEGKTIWAPGVAGKSDMSYYKGLYADNADNTVYTEAEAKAAIKEWLEDNKSGTIKANNKTVVGIDVTDWTIDNSLNIKNRGEKYYHFTSQYGQTVTDHSVEFATDSSVDDYVYRAYVYIIDKNGTNAVAAISDPAYFSMKNVSSIGG